MQQYKRIFRRWELFTIGAIKKSIVHLRRWAKVNIMIILAAALVVGAILFIYKPTYNVTLNGEFIGYTQDKAKLQQKINDYIEKGNGENVAFVEINELPEYTLCFLKKDAQTNDEEIFNKVVGQGTNYYKYYSINVGEEEKEYVATFDEAEEIIDQLKEKDSNNQDKLSITEKYETELEEFTSIETAVANLYEKKPVKVTSSYVVAATGMNSSAQKVELGISLIRPVSGIVTSRFGARWGRSHKGIDIGASKGTAIYAAASGTVSTSSYGYNGGYGNYLIIDHGNGVQTLYGHCTSLEASVGQYVSQGQLIATVGSTGNSTGNHLHLEIRVNGVAQNPQNYLY